MLGKILRNLGSIFGLILGISLLGFGLFRVSMGINSIRLSDSFTAHFMNVGLMYIYLGLLILIISTIVITYSLIKK